MSRRVGPKILNYDEVIYERPPWITVSIIKHLCQTKFQMGPFCPKRLLKYYVTFFITFLEMWHFIFKNSCFLRLIGFEPRTWKHNLALKQDFLLPKALKSEFKKQKVFMRYFVDMQTKTLNFFLSLKQNIASLRLT